MVWMLRIVLVCAVASLFGCGGNTGVETPDEPAAQPTAKPAAAAPTTRPSVD